MTAPRYQEYAPETIPVATLAEGVTAKVVAGRIGGVTGPVEAGDTDPVFLDLTLAPGSETVIPLPEEHNAFLYPHEGSVLVGEGGDRLARGRVAVLSTGDHVTLVAEGAVARLLLIAGQPIREPVAKYGPFVMNSEAELRQAVEDFRAGRF